MNATFLIALATALFSVSVWAQQVPRLEYHLAVDGQQYRFAYVHFDPYVEQYVLDAFLSERDGKLERSRLAESDIIAISRDGKRAQPIFSEPFDYNYSRDLGDVLGDPKDRIVREFKCNVSDTHGKRYSLHHPCGSRFVRPDKVELWPTLAGKMAGRAGNLSAFSLAVLNEKEVRRVLAELSLPERAASKDASDEVMPAPAELVINDTFVLEGWHTAYKISDVRFLREGRSPPQEAHIVLQGDRTIWGKKTIALADVRRLYRTVHAIECPQYDILLKSGEAKHFGRCNGSPFFAEINGNYYELQEVAGLAQPVRDGRLVVGTRVQRLSMALGNYQSENGLVPGGLEIVSSLAVLTQEEVARLTEK